MQCPECHSSHIRKNGKNKGKQNHICVDCGRQFITEYEPHRGYSDEMRRQCLKMYVNGMGFRAIERVTGVHHTTVINWVKQVGELLPDAYEPESVPEVGELDELQTFVGKKRQNLALDSGRPFSGGYFGLDNRRPQFGYLPSIMGTDQELVVLFLGHRWLVSVS